MTNDRATTTRCSVTVPATCEEAFDLIHDYDRRLEWDTLLRSATLLDANEAGVGVVCRCTARWRNGGLHMDARYISFDRPRVAAIEKVGGVPLLDTFAASITHRPDGDGCRVTYAFNFTVKPRWLAPVVRPVFERRFREETEQRLEALRAFFARSPSGTSCRG